MERICDTRKLNQPDRHRVATRLFKKILLKIKITRLGVDKVKPKGWF